MTVKGTGAFLSESALRADPAHLAKHAETPELEDVRAFWRAKAEDWTDQADIMAAQADKYNRPLVDAIDIQPGHIVLDLASGAGEPAFTARVAAGERGCVVASDLVPEMMAGLRARDRKRPIPALAADMQRLPFKSDTFDRALCRFGIMFVPDPRAALGNVERVLKPSGRAGFMVWGPREDQTLFSTLSAAVADVYDIEPDHHHFQIFRFGAPGSLASVFKEAGFTEVSEEERRFNTLAPLDKPFWRPQVAMGFGHIVRDPDATALAEIDDAMRRHLEPAREDGGYRIQSLLRIVTGRA